MPDATVLATVRQEIDYNFDEFESLLTAPAFAGYFGELNRDGALKRPPKGYTADNPAIEYLKLKSLTVTHSLTDAALTKPTLAKQVLDGFATLHPLVTYLNRAVG